MSAYFRHKLILLVLTSLIVLHMGKGTMSNTEFHKNVSALLTEVQLA
ncbi:hypothetical protein [Paenibacillus sp. yr247]|nr:hypothetical protein [Paenibacillus sp. yr247]